MDVITKFLTPGIGFLVTLIFGFWMSRNGTPYNGILFNFHKLAALGTVIITAMQVDERITTLRPETVMFLWLSCLVGSVLGLFVTGAFMSIGNMKHKVMKTIHNTALVVVILSMGMNIYFLESSPS